MPSAIFNSFIVAKYDKAKRGLRASWRPGTLEWLREHAIARLMAMEIAERALDAAWARAERSDCSEAEFDATLEAWRAACAAAVEEFKNSGER